MMIKMTDEEHYAVYLDIFHAVQSIFTQGQVIELRVLRKGNRVDSGYFDDFNLLAQQAMKYDALDEVKGIYWTLNPTKPECLHRAHNKVREWVSKAEPTTSDTDILERRLLLIDFDGTNRPSGISSTDAELKMAEETALRAAKFLFDLNWGIPIIAMSGNGYHLQYRISLPNDDDSRDLIKNLLHVLAVLFDNDTISIDQTVYNAARICKVYGTVARKGDNTPERPHRRSLLEPLDNDVLPLISADMIQSVISLLPEQPPDAPQKTPARIKGSPVQSQAGKIDVPDWVDKNLGGITIVDTKESGGATLYRLSECPYNPQHSHPDAVIGQYPSGAVYFKCFHNSCSDKNWSSLRKDYEVKDDSKSKQQSQRGQRQEGGHGAVISASSIEFPDVYGTGKPKPTLPNFHVVINYHSIQIYYDEIKKDTSILFKGGNSYSVDNTKEASLARVMSILEQEGMPVRHLDQYICEVADDNRINPAKNLILSKPWDGTNRLPMLCDTIITPPGFPKETYIGKWLLSAVVAACHDPRQMKFSTRGVLVLAGKQGLGKTRWIRRLAPPEWICDGVMLDPSNKDSVMLALAFWIVELGELDSTFRKDIGRLKAFITKEQDQLRVPYARTMSQYPRRTVFCASVNEPEFLVDRTGNDRFWVIPVLDVNYNHDIDMQQVYAQLYAEWQEGKQWWLTPEESKQLAASNAAFEETDEIYDLLTSRIDWTDFPQKLKEDKVVWLNATKVLMQRCGFGDKIPTKAQKNSCAAHLRKLTGMDAKQVHGKGRTFPIPKGDSMQI